METIQTKLLKLLKEKKRLSTTKENTADELDTVQKLEAFGMVVENRKFSFKPTSRFYKYGQKIIDSQTPVEEFDFEEKEEAINTNVFNNTYNGNIGQVNQGNIKFNIDEINIDIIKSALEKLEPDQKDKLNEALNKKDKKEILTTLKSFGKDVLGNIVANIVTNPGLFGL